MQFLFLSCITKHILPILSTTQLLPNSSLDSMTSQKPKCNHFISLLHSLQWLPTARIIKYKFPNFLKQKTQPSFVWLPSTFLAFSFNYYWFYFIFSQDLKLHLSSFASESAFQVTCIHSESLIRITLEHSSGTWLPFRITWKIF